jgi:hypothetical protein
MTRPGQALVPVTILASIKVDGEFITTSDVTDILYVTSNEADRETEIESGSLTVEEVILSEPVTDDSRWNNRVHPEGYNILATIPGDAFPQDGITYVIRLDFKNGSSFIARIQEKYRVEALYPEPE